jgi:hypothetical protein
MKKPIFIGGCSSSGTTLLRRILGSHSNIAAGVELSIFDRPGFYDLDMRDFRKALKLNNFSALDGNGHVFPVTTPSGSYCLFNRANYHNFEDTAKMAEETQSPIEFMDLFMETFAKKEGKIRWLEKTPNNIFCADKILDTWPDAKFIHIIRDGRDAVLSMMRKRKMTPFAACCRWLGCITKHKDMMPHDRFFYVRYEKLVTQPQQTLEAVCSLIGEEFEENLLRFSEIQEPDSNQWGYGNSPINIKSVGTWEKADIPKGLRDMVELILRTPLQTMGY